jgi:molybdopterin/thiamine biosynthesis adenylyltransferase
MSEDITKSRFSDATWFNTPYEIILGGAGGIGSWTALFLARIGHILHIYDMDVIDDVNIAGQLYQKSQIGINKAKATADNCHAFSNCEIYTYEEPFTEEHFVTPITISAFDNMAARKLMFEKWCELEDRELFLDGRMLAEVGMVFAVKKGDEDKYRKHLFDDAEVEDAPCSFKATSHCGALIGSLITSNLNNYISNKVTGMDVREVSFLTSFQLPMTNFEIEHE